MRLVKLDQGEREILRLTIGPWGRTARLRLGLSQTALARARGRSASWVREIERGDQYAPPYLLRALGSSLGVSVGWFYGEDVGVRALAEAVLDAVRRDSCRPAQRPPDYRDPDRLG